MPRHNPSGPPKGRRASSSRSNTTGKSFQKKSDQPYSKRSPRADSPDQSSSKKDKFPGSSRTGSFGNFSKRSSPSNRDEKGESGRKRAYPDSRDDKRPYKKSEPGRSSSFKGGGKEERPFKKFDKPDSRKSGFTRSDSSPFKKRSSSADGERPIRRSGGPGRDKPSFREESPFKKRSSTPSSPEKRPYKKVERPERPSDNTENEKASGRSAFKKPAFKKTERDSTSENRERPFRKRTGESNSGKFSPEKGKVTPLKHTPSPDGKIRLNKFISNSGVCSRREADELIKMGLITVNGQTISELGYKVNPGDEIRHEGKVLRAEKPVYILMNKPKGFLTTTVDPQERNTVMHLIGNVVKERVYPVGRLDRNTTGLLLLTNDGDLAEKLMHPSYNVKKIYKVDLDRPLTKADAQRILEGVKLEEGRAMVDDLAIVSDDRKTIGVEIHIGWNRVVRRIFESLEYNVVKLDRTVYAGLNKKDLGRGEWRFLKKEELVLLKHFQ